MLLMNGVDHPHGVLNEYVKKLTGFATFDAKIMVYITEEGPCMTDAIFSNIGSIVRALYTARQTPAPPEPPQHFVELPQHSVPTPANSNTFSANSDGPLANSDIFPAAAGASPGLPEPLRPLPAVPDPITRHQLDTLASPTYPGVSRQPWNGLRHN
ncbi:hypothetical protein H2248_006940 [Termitomyces sp. 'cryptogamus']|nr:hypothetical protein H2248_006940 [Termitomyces sp. 'cryptogamus']